jgi:hypothetical protein
MSEYFGCDGNYVNTGGYANVTVDNPFSSTLMTGDTLIEGAGQSNAGVLDPHNGSLVVAHGNWELPSPTLMHMARVASTIKQLSCPSTHRACALHSAK